MSANDELSTGCLSRSSFSFVAAADASKLAAAGAATWFALVLVWAISSHAAANVAAVHGTRAVLLLPVALFAALIAPAVAFGCSRQSQGSLGHKITSVWWGRADGVESNGGIVAGGGTAAQDEAQLRRRTMLARIAGFLSALSVSLTLWQAHKLDERVWQALEVLTLAATTLLARLASQTLPAASRAVTSSWPMTATGLVTSFLAGLVLIGVPSNHSALVLASLRIPLEATRWLVIKEGFDDERGSGIFLLQTTMNALLSSIGFLIVGCLLPTSENKVAAMTFDVKASTIFLFSCLLTQAMLVLHLLLAANPLGVGTAVVVRNLVLLLWLSTGHRGAALRANWMQMLIVLICGALAALACQDDWSSTWSRFVDTNWFRLEDRRRASGWEPVEKGPNSPSPAVSSAVSSASNGPASSSSNVGSSPSRLRDNNARDYRSQPSWLMTILPFVPVLVYLVRNPTLSSINSACSYLPLNVRATLCHTSFAVQARSVDLVIAYYNEDLEATQEHLSWFLQTPFVGKKDNRILIYNKGPRSEGEIRKGLALRYTDKVVKLPNVGREGHTYLQHILLHYNESIADIASAISSPASGTAPELRSKVLADHTIMLQPHMAWHWIAKPRFEIVGPDTGFAHLGPMIRNECGYDTRVDTHFPLVKELWGIFRGEICPPSGILTAWSAQFVVSKRRILANAYHRYAAVADLLAAPEGHWIHDMWGANDSHGPSNPAFGHHVERAWPFIMGCTDPTIADQCGDADMDREKCQCFDE
ncbi:hypothetical protein OIO90_001811 [Microbotryomycetes sp. JL221]|nr:hypothetical protein OIO90_001811 [Microbotryomycetes sp. JL221]